MPKGMGRPTTTVLPCFEAGGAERVVGRAEGEDGLVVALGGGEDGGVGRIGWRSRRRLLGSGVLVAALVRKPGLDLRGAPARCGIWNDAMTRPSR